MIKLITWTKEEVEIEINYMPEIKTYNIVSSLMADDCRPYRIANSMMMWLTNNGYIGELECIYPKNVEENLCSIDEKVKKINGYPQLDITGNDKAYVQHNNSSFILWFASGKHINLLIVNQDLNFLIAGDELVGIECRNFKVAK